jgi:recombinational DNA repair protein (RecF pathway)
MDSRHCAVCGEPIEFMDVFIVRAQGKICSRCVLSRGIPVSGLVSRQALHRGRWREMAARPRFALVEG